jgi:hypothetical protein
MPEDINRPCFWQPVNFMTKEGAESFVEHAMPRQVQQCCGERNDGFVCNLFAKHTGDHEAWGLGHVKHHSWHNCNDHIRSN